MTASRLLAASLVLALLGTLGCRAVRWSRPGATEQEFYAAYGRCESSLGNYWCYGTACSGIARQRSAQWERCMGADGWTPSSSRGFDTSGHSFTAPR